MMASIAKEAFDDPDWFSKPSWTATGRLPWLIRVARLEFGRATTCHSNRSSRRFGMWSTR